MSTSPSFDPKKETPQDAPVNSTQIIVSALKGLTESTQSLIKHHIALAKQEAKADAIEVGKDITGLVVAGIFSALGYVLLLMSSVLFASWFAGVKGMALTSLTLALIHLIGGGVIALRLLNNFKTRHYGLIQTSREVKHTKKWFKGPLQDEFSLPSLPEHTSSTQDTSTRP